MRILSHYIKTLTGRMTAAFTLLFLVAVGGFVLIGFLTEEDPACNDIRLIKELVLHHQQRIRETIERFNPITLDKVTITETTEESLALLKVNVSVLRSYMESAEVKATLTNTTNKSLHPQVLATCDKFNAYISEELKGYNRKDSLSKTLKENLASQSTLLNQACLINGLLSFGTVKLAETKLIQSADSVSAAAFDLALINFELDLAKNTNITPQQLQEITLQFDLYKQLAYDVNFKQSLPAYQAEGVYRNLSILNNALTYYIGSFSFAPADYSSLLASSTGLYNWLILGFTLAFSLGISLHYSRALTIPISRLARVVDGMVSNNFKQINRHNLKTNINELLMLNNSVFMMANTIQENIEMIARKNEDLANLYNETLDNINTARTIQHSLMPPMKEMLLALPESFVLNRPKDIVSGDFYWIDNNSDVLKIAVADCTGHGVAGAFMSFVGHSLMTRIADETPIFFDAASILDRLNDGVKQTLRQADDGSFTQNGMDISLVCIDFFRGVLHFAGANQTLYIIRNGELNTIKSNKFSIGGPSHKANMAFTNHKIAFLPGDSIYLTSDGFADQIGGPTGDEKFKTSRLRTLFLNINNLPMEEQGKVLSKVLERWLGPNQLLDDVLVIGFKVPDL